MTTPEAPADSSAVLRIAPGQSSAPRVVVLVLHGGQQVSRSPVRRWHLAYLRMMPFARAIQAAVAGSDVAVWLLRNRVRGWNAPDLDPVQDARWALAEIQRRHPGAQVVIVGHSMGGRVALRVAGDDNVVGVCALAPWTERSDPVEQLAGREVLIVHGDRDRITLPRSSASYVDRAAQEGITVRRELVVRSGHAMLRSARTWTSFVRDFVLTCCGEAEKSI